MTYSQMVSLIANVAALVSLAVLLMLLIGLKRAVFGVFKAQEQMNNAQMQINELVGRRLDELENKLP